MKTSLKRLVSILVCIAMLLPLVVVELPTTAEATNHGVYDTLAMVYDLGSCPSMQGFGLCGDYFYAIKTDGDDYAAAVCRVNKDTGSKTWLTNGGNNTNYFYDFGHGNDCEVVVAGGVTTMFVPTSKTGSNSLVRYKISGTTATKVCGYQMVNTSDANMGGGAIRVVRVDDENIYLLFKTGNSLYTGTLPISQNGGKIVMTFLCTLDYSEVVVNGTAMDTSGWVLQGFGYHDHMVYLPITGNHSADTINISLIAVYDIEGASGTIKPLPDPTFRVTSSAYSALFEMESCVIDPETNRLYFNTNRRKTSSDTNHDGIHYITNWTYEPQNRTTEVNNYRWEMEDDGLLSVTDGGAVYNGLAMHHGSVSGGTISDGRYATSKTVVLEADRPWIVEWKSNGCSAGELLFATQAVSNYTDAPYIFVNDNNARISIGAYDGSQYNNYGVTLSNHGVDGTQPHVYRLTNKPASDGSNMVYLSVDGKELGPMNNYYIAGTSQGTTSNWVSGQDFRFSYIGTNNHPINDNIEYIQVWGNGILGQVDEPDTYRWETQTNALVNITGFDFTKNTTTALWGSISGGTHSGVQCDIDRNVVLLHNRPWSVEWRGNYSGGSMILAGDNMGNTEGSPYLYRSGILAFGERKGGAHHNYGIKLSDHGISYSDTHTYRLTNRIADDGSNMVYLYVDGVEIGAMNNYYKGTTDQGVTSDWLNGRDLTFTHLGTYQYKISGTLEYLQIWEDGIPTQDEPDNYRWEVQSDTLTSITTGGNTENVPTMLDGAISDGTFTEASYYRLDKSVVLLHDRPWSVQWQAEGSWGSGTMLFSASDTTNQLNAPYLFRHGSSTLLAFGQREGSYHHNYGINLASIGIDATAKHTYLLTNKIADDGSNMVYLYVDGVEIGPMNNYYQGVNSQGTTSDWISGKDFVFSFLGMHSYPINSVTIDYIQVWENCSHTFGDWVVTEATCTVDGSQSRTCTECGYTETEVIAATGHTYDKISHAGDCQQYQRDEYICADCGHSYIVFPNEMWSDWVETLPEGVDESMVETKTQYSYSDYETTTSYETSLDGYTQTGSEWVQSGSGTVNYVNSWPSGFSTSSSVYSTYNKKSSKVTASETTTSKTVVNSDAVVGYLYYHWCYSGSYYSVSSSSGSYTTFHAFYSTTNPSDCTNYDSSDGSYYYPNSSCCSNSDWYWYAEVYAQKYTTYNKLFTYGRWTDYSDWSDTAVTASDTRKVQTRTVYRYLEAQYGDHDYTSVVTAPTCTTNGYTTHTCTICGDSYTDSVVTAPGHSWTSATCTAAKSCTVCGITEGTASGHSYDSGVITTAPGCTTAGIKTYTCTGCGESFTEYVSATGHTYVPTVTAPTCTENGYTTYTCSDCGDTYTDSVVGATGHSYNEGVITTAPTCTAAGIKTFTCSCGDSYTEDVAALGHSYNAVVTAPTCVAAGYTTHTCSVCGESYTDSETPATGIHTYEDGVCTVCGAVEAVPTVKMSSVSLALKDEVKFTGYFTIENIDASTSTMGLMTFENAPTDVSVDTADHVIPGATYQSSKDRYIGYSQGIPAKEMGDLFYICAYVQLENGTYVYSDVVEYSVEKYAYAMLDYTNDTDLQKLLIAMLNYGAEAQLYFGYNTDDLVNADLTDEQKNSLNSYSSDLMDAIVTADSSKTGRFVYTEAAFSTKSVNVTAGGALALSYRFNPAYTMDGDMTLYYWDAETYNSVSELTTANATGSATMTVVNGAYQASVTGIAAKDIDKTIYAVGVYESDGVTYTTGVISYNLNTYFDILPQVRPACQGVCEAAVVYCDYAKLYFLGE